MTESRWNIRQVYLYLVSFATLMMLIVGSVQLIMGVVDLVYPDPTKGMGYYDTKIRLSDMQQKYPNLTQEEFEKQLQEEKQNQEAAWRYQRIRRFINSLALVVVSLPFYLYHWRKIQRGVDIPA
ncbi:hypothetical protein Psch_03348 [Pelotomaculum schinkii]|uniref:DUF5671 domain-containing protein n=2 Tax=Pelotomaculum TaxID=191373 RepID=A0A4Y7R6K4_9FIRM|nr:hypothetical protein [Pelotomaculum schinkii]TEB04588.1 hypothetical protein Psch_03348 [Pelotomaculum schinkii]